MAYAPFRTSFRNHTAPRSLTVVDRDVQLPYIAGGTRISLQADDAGVRGLRGLSPHHRQAARGPIMRAFGIVRHGPVQRGRL
jgi:hypothetical protein